MLGLLRQPLIKSVKIAQSGVQKFAQPILRVLNKSYGRCNLSYYANHAAPNHKTEWIKKTCMIGGFVLANCVAYDVLYYMIKKVYESNDREKKCCGCCCCNQCKI